MTKQEAYKTFKCQHCVFLDRDTGICLCGDPESEDCPLHRLNNGSGYGCATFISHEPERAVEILQKWSDENPVKTRLDDFKEKYPNYFREPKDDTPNVCCRYLGYIDKCPLTKCSKCWDMPL